MKREIRRVAQRRQNVPGHGNQQNDEQSAERTQPFPGASLNNWLVKKR